MCFLMELAKAKRRIRELEEDIANLLEQAALGVDKPSPADIVKSQGIGVVGSLIAINIEQLNIPFLQTPLVLPIDEIPNSKSMDGLFDKGNNNLYIEPVDEENHKIMVDWIAQQWLDSKGLQTADVIYRIMTNEVDSPRDFAKPYLWYAIHRLIEVGTDDQGRFFWFAGVNSLARDPYPARDKNLLFLNIGTIF